MALHPGLKRSLRPYRHHALQVAALRGGAAVAAGWGAALLGRAPRSMMVSGVGVLAPT